VRYSILTFATALDYPLAIDSFEAEEGRHAALESALVKTGVKAATTAGDRAPRVGPGLIALIGLARAP
jgi:hypothetical protein